MTDFIENQWRIDSLDDSGTRCFCSPWSSDNRFSHFGKRFIHSQDGPQFESFLRQAAVGQMVEHSGVPALAGFNLDASQPLLVYPRLDARTLSEWLDGPLGNQPFSSRIAVARQLLEALSAIHDAGFSHGQLQCEHILVSGGGLVKIVGLGACQRVGLPSELTRSRTPYNAPETCRLGFEVSSAQDIYSTAPLLTKLFGESFAKTSLAQAMQALSPADRPQASELLNLVTAFDLESTTQLRLKRAA